LRIELSITELKEICKLIPREPEDVLKLIRDDLPRAIGEYLSGLIRLELEQFLGRKPYERKQSDGNHRNGYYRRRFSLKRIGEVLVRIARDRQGKFRSRVLPRSKRYERELRQDICLLYLTGVSTRSLSLISAKLLGRKVSAGEVSRVSKELVEAVERWRNRDLSQERIKYLINDGVHFKMRVVDSVESVPVLVVVGVREDGGKLVLGFQAGDRESASSWREFFRDLKRRGLRWELIKLGVMDGIPALEQVFKEEFPQAEVQRCLVHLSRNVLAKVPRKLKGEIASELRGIFYAPSEEEAREKFADFKTRWENYLPSATRCLEKALNSALTFFKFPAEDWLSIRTTNIIERLNKEFKRRTKVMEIVASEKALYNLLAFICLKMEIYWRRSPMERVVSAMFIPQLKAASDFTQNA